MTSRSYCFTYNLTEKISELPWSATCLEKDGLLRYLVAQLEKAPTTGTYHLQGYLELNKSVRIAQVKKLLGTPTIHLEKRKGTPSQAREYCMKEDTREAGPWEFGEWTETKQGKRSDLSEVAAAIKEGATIAKIRNDHPELYCRYRNGLNDLAGVALKENTKKWRNVDVWIMWGESGTGKTRAAMDGFSDFFMLDRGADGKNVWFDGYEGESTLIIDDFYGWISYGFLLRLLDGHPVRCPVKGSFTYANWTTVILTSNARPSSWYTWGEHICYDAFKRRISNIRYMWWNVDSNGDKFVEVTDDDLPNNP